MRYYSLFFNELYVKCFISKAPSKRMQNHPILMNSTLLDDVGPHGQTNATCCAVQTRIVEIRDMGGVMTQILSQTTRCPCLRDDILCVHECNKVEVRGQTSATLLFTHGNKRNIERCYIKCLMEIKLR